MSARQPRLGGVSGRVANAMLFHLSWIAIVLAQSSAIALAVVAAHLLVHFALLGRGRGEVGLVAGVAAAGVVLDQLLFLAGVFNLDGRAALAPLWLMCLWPVFATTLLHAFAGLHGRPVVAAVLGAVGGAAAYVAGVRLSAVDFGSALWGPLILALLWAALLPLLLGIAARVGRGRDALQAWEPGGRRMHDARH